MLDCGRLISADLTFVGMANQRRGHADTCSKVTCHPFLCQSWQSDFSLEQVMPWKLHSAVKSFCIADNLPAHGEASTPELGDAACISLHQRDR